MSYFICCIYTLFVLYSCCIDTLSWQWNTLYSLSKDCFGSSHSLTIEGMVMVVREEAMEVMADIEAMLVMVMARERLKLS